MSIKQGKKLGFFASLAMLIGSVVGIGIFLKNHSILSANAWSGSGTLVSWIIGGLLSLAAAVSFSEMSSLKHGKTAGLTDWAEKGGGKKYGYFVRFNYSFFYISVLTIVISIFASETVIGIITGALGVEQPHFAVIAIVGVVLAVIYISLNYFSVKASGVFQQVTVVLKFIPLILVALVGIILATTNHQPAKVSPTDPLFGHNGFTNGRSFDFTKMLAALPAVLFAYDAFLITASLRPKMKSPEKLPKVVIVGMSTTIILYMFIAIAAILHGSGMVSGRLVGAPSQAGLGIFDQTFTGSTATGMGMFAIVFIAISTLGVLNGLSAGAIAIISQGVETETFAGSTKVKAKFGNRAGIIYLIGFFTFWFLIITIPGIVANSDKFIDAISNFPTLFFFAIYALTILLYQIKRKEFENKKINKYLFQIAASVAIAGIGFVVGYQLFYGMTTRLLLNPKGDSGAGLFAGHVANFANIDLFATFISMLVIFIVMPQVNKLLLKKIDNKEAYISTQG